MVLYVVLGIILLPTLPIWLALMGVLYPVYLVIGLVCAACNAPAQRRQWESCNAPLTPEQLQRRRECYGTRA